MAAGLEQRVHRTHAREDHGGVELGVDPGQAADEVVAQRAEDHGRHEQAHPEHGTARLTLQESAAGQERRPVVLEHGASMGSAAPGSTQRGAWPAPGPAADTAAVEPARPR